MNKIIDIIYGNICVLLNPKYISFEAIISNFGLYWLKFL